MAVSFPRISLLLALPLLPLAAFVPAARAGSANVGSGSSDSGPSANDEAIDQAALATVTAHPFLDRCAHTTTAANGARLASCLAKVRADAAGNVLASATPSGLAPADLVAAYAVPRSTSTATIAVVDAQNDPFAEADLAVYRKRFGLPPCTRANGCFAQVNQRGEASPLPSDDARWSGEIALDIEVAGAACPTCKILLVEAEDASFESLGAAVTTAVKMGAAVIANGYGGDESADDARLDDAVFHHPGVAMFAGTGDHAYGVPYPASGRWVIGVGGTSLVGSASARGWAEKTWEGGGSGCSKSTSAPSWQVDGHAGCAHKMVSDLSAVGDPNTGVAVYDSFGSGGWVVGGGTSVATALVASIFAATGHANAYGATIWKHPSDFFDVTRGSNGVCKTSYFCTAGKGYDAPTGWGSPNGAKLAAWSATEDVTAADE